MDVGTSEKKQKLFTWLNSGNEDFLMKKGGVAVVSSKSPDELLRKAIAFTPYHVTRSSRAIGNTTG